MSQYMYSGRREVSQSRRFEVHAVVSGRVRCDSVLQRGPYLGRSDARTSLSVLSVVRAVRYRRVPYSTARPQRTEPWTKA